jgi:hypothetical protein
VGDFGFPVSVSVALASDGCRRKEADWRAATKVFPPLDFYEVEIPRETRKTVAFSPLPCREITPKTFEFATLCKKVLIIGQYQPVDAFVIWT